MRCPWDFWRFQKMEGCTTWRRTLAQYSPSESWARQLWVPWVKTSRSRPLLTLEIFYLVNLSEDFSFTTSSRIFSACTHVSNALHRSSSLSPAALCTADNLSPTSCKLLRSLFTFISKLSLSTFVCISPEYWRLLPGNHPESWLHLWGYPCREGPCQILDKHPKDKFTWLLTDLWCPPFHKLCLDFVVTLLQRNWKQNDIFIFHFHFVLYSKFVCTLQHFYSGHNKQF